MERVEVDCVIVCQNYADFLSCSLPFNSLVAKRIAVVTHESDKSTQEICRQYAATVTCLKTDCMNRDGAPFNKGRAIDHGIRFLEPEGWTLVIDADIILPPNLPRILARSGLDRTKIYGADRACINGYQAYDNFRKNFSDASVTKDGGYILNLPENVPLGSRFVHWKHGYIPIGYFQLFHSSAGLHYPLQFPTAGESDVEFAAQWKREDRILIPDFFVYHLESEDAAVPLGENWQGRRTRPFGPL